ncbi:mushroom body large-type Kenyon cell-specific protein 1-like [Vespula squamosa]|uniref:Mushroom body large-type Kenyon cell-specific protein 1-like n=1 Tax=Vespula squamosa TaxID=30214 RepID=A0ABD2BLY9_VESSQ
MIIEFKIPTNITSRKGFFRSSYTTVSPSTKNNANVDVGPPVVVQAAQAQKKESHENIARIAKRYLDDNMQQAWINPRLISMDNVSRQRRERGFSGSEIGVYHGLEGRSSKEEEYLDTSALCASLAHDKSSFKIIESTGGIIMAILITYCRAVPCRRKECFKLSRNSVTANEIVFISCVLRSTSSCSTSQDQSQQGQRRVNIRIDGRNFNRIDQQTIYR